MSRFYVPPEQVQTDKIFIEGEEAHHILDVMRLKDGDTVVVFDGTGNQYTGYIKSVDKKHHSLIVGIIKVEKPSQDNIPEVTLVQAIPKKGKIDYILEKGTELGVKTFIPIITDRTIVRPVSNSSSRKVERWKKIVTTAAKQCGRVVPPEIEGISNLHEIKKTMDKYDLVLFASLQDETYPIKEVLTSVSAAKILIVIGPEGGFSPAESGIMNDKHCKFVSLGKSVLKSDTAGLYILSIIKYIFS